MASNGQNVIQELDNLSTTLGTQSALESLVKPQINGGVVDDTTANKVAGLSALVDTQLKIYNTKNMIENLEIARVSRYDRRKFPFISAVKTRYTASETNRNMTTERGNPSTTGFSQFLLALLAGIKKDPATNFVTLIPEAQLGFEHDVCIQSSKSDRVEGRFQRGNVAFTWADAQFQSYSSVPVMAFAIKNKSLSAQVVNTGALIYAFTSFNASACRGVFQINPDANNANRSSVSSLSFISLDSDTTDAFAERNVPQFTVPANSSIILMFYGADKYQGANYCFFREAYIKGLENLWANPNLEPDYDLIENIERGYKGHTVFNNYSELWSIIPQQYRDLDVSAYPEYATNALAVAELGVGVFYYNTTDAKLTKTV